MGELRIWGRANSVNVQKVLWCCGELGLAFERTDAGMAFGQVDTPEYREMNPNGRVPTLADGGFVLWESNAIMRYLTLKQIEARSAAAAALYPTAAVARAPVERWLDWTLSTVQPVERPLFWGLVRTAPVHRDRAAIAEAAKACGAIWAILDAHLAHGRPFVEGDSFTLADLALAAYARRWFGVEFDERPRLDRLRAWYDGLTARPSFQLYVAPPLS